ncbi:hypothetical protein CE948_07190, partial [Campylobacter jejuni]|nr:hypothetical protein [Campylobacter jejuni]
MITYSNLSDVKKRIEDEFTHRNAECDKYDYLIAITCGAIAGIMDIFLVGNPKDSYLGKKVDKTVEKMTQKFAQLCGWDKQKALDKNKDLTKSAIAFLENKFKINYDQTTTNGRNGTNGKVDNLSMKNHHLKSIGHSPDIFGLFVSIVNQFTNTSTFVSNGKIITIDTNTFELQGGNFIAKIFCGFFNWFGHLASDWCGSSGGKERGAGIPMPFYNLFLLCDFGNFGQHRQTLAQIATQVFEQGYDLRHGVTMSIPVMINEMLIRFMYIIKAKFYHKKEWKECIPKDDIPELNKMLLIGSGTFLLIDTGGAWIKSKNPITNPVVFLSEINLINVIRFSTLILKEIYILYNNGKIDNKKLEKYLDDTCKIL